MWIDRNERGQFTRTSPTKKSGGSSAYIGVCYQAPSPANPTCKTCGRNKRSRKGKDRSKEKSMRCICQQPVWIIKGEVVAEKDLYRFVYKRKKPWVANIKVKGKQKRIGSYATEIEAAEAWDLKALELFGEHTLLNFPKKFEAYKNHLEKGRK